MKKEYIIAGIIGLSILILNNIPMLVGFIGNRDGMFLGRKPINFPDTYTYIAAIEQARQGKILFTNLYTSERQKALLFRPSYLFIGTVARATGLPSLGAFHLFRIIFSIIFLFVSYRFLGLFFHNASSRLLSFLVMLTSAGLGFLLSSIANQPIDLWMPEANTFLMLAEAPHFILSQILILVTILGYLAYRSHKNTRYLLLSPGLLMFLSFEHPYTVIPLLFTIGGLHIWSKGSWGALGLFMIISSVGFLPYLYQIRTNSGFLVWMSQDISRSPDAVSYLLGYGFLVIFAVLGVVVLFKKIHMIETKLLLLWIVIIAVLIYAPYASQRRFIEGLHIPLAILGTEGIIVVVRAVASRRLMLLASFLFAGIMMPTTFMRIVWDTQAIQNDTKESYFFHLTADEVSAMQWLGVHTGESDVILSNFFYGNLIPGLTGRTVYLGHPADTFRFENKIQSINAFLVESDEEKARTFLHTQGIKIIYLGRNDSMRLYGFVPEGRPYLTRVYNQGGVEIYQVL